MRTEVIGTVVSYDRSGEVGVLQNEEVEVFFRLNKAGMRLSGEHFTFAWSELLIEKQGGSVPLSRNLKPGDVILHFVKEPEIVDTRQVLELPPLPKAGPVVYPIGRIEAMRRGLFHRRW